MSNVVSTTPITTLKPSVTNARVKIEIAILVCVFILVLLWNYRHIISIAFAYQGFFYEPPTLWLTISSWVLALVPILWLPLRTERPSQFVYFVLYITTYVPACVIIPVSWLRSPVDIFALQLCVAVSFFLIGTIYRLPLPTLKPHPVSSGSFSIYIYLLVFSGCALIAWKFGVSFKMHAFKDIYEVRLQMRETLSSGNRLFGYLLAWQCNVFVPLLFIWSFHHRKWLVVSAAVVLELWLYSITAKKSVFFSLLAVVAVLIILRIKRRSLGWNIVAGSAGVVALFTLIDVCTYSTKLSSLGVRRIFVVPGYMLGSWYDFFADNPKAYLGHSIFRYFVDYPYNAPPSFVVALNQFKETEMSANVNLWGDGYANFGMAGIILASILLAGFLHIYDALSKGVDPVLSTGVLVIPGMSLTNGALLTVMLTHGLGLAMLAVFLMPREKSLQRPQGKNTALT